MQRQGKERDNRVEADILERREGQEKWEKISG